MDFNQLWQEYKEIILIIAGAAAALLGQRILPGLWKALVRLYEKLRMRLGRRLSETKFERRYLEQLCEEHRFLKVRGIRTRSPVAVELEQVYVSLTLRRPSRDRLDVEARLEEAPEQASLEKRQPALIRRPTTEAQERERLHAREVLHRCPEWLVILGGPGTGKTTLLSYLTLKFARGAAKEELDLDEKRLPILIPLRELPRTGLALTTENLPALCTTPELAKEYPEGFFERRLQDGDCIVLLDGMDEVTTEGERRLVAEQIEDFVTTYNKNRFIVTSRPTGYSGVALAGFTQLDVCDFNDEDVEAFARHWCLAVELAVRGVEREISEAVARRKAEHEAKELIAAIRANDRVRRLTVNPLLLTIVAMVHRYRATLPNRRVDLYDECTQVLLGYWDEAKGIAGQLDWARKRRVLEPLADWMHQQGLREAESAQVQHIIAEALPTVGQKRTDAAEFLNNVRERSGLLMERGVGTYGFSHLTFQEYLTASHLIDRGEVGRETLLQHLHNPWWLEVTLLYAGMQNATPLIEAILTQRDDVFKNNLLLASRCLVDVLNIDPHVEAQVLSQLMAEFQTGEFEGLRERATEALVELANSPTAPKVVEALLDQLGDEDEGVRGRAASALGELKQAEPQVVEALLGRLGDEDEGVRWSAASALGQLGQGEPQVVEALLALLGDEDASVRAGAASALGWSGQGEPQVVEALLGLLGDEDENVRGRAVYALGELKQAEPQVVEALLGLLGDEDEDVRRRAVYALGELGQGEPQVVEALLGLLGDEDASVRAGAAYALGELGQGEPQVVEALLGRLGDEDASVRAGAASALGELEQGEPQVVEALLALLSDEDAGVRGRAVYALGELGQGELQVVEALLALLGDEDGNAVRAFRVLRANQEAVTALLATILSPDKAMRSGAALALDPGSRIEYALEKKPAISSIHLSSLTRLLDSETEVDYSIFDDFLEKRRKVRDVAWNLLEQYNKETGERIYWDGGNDR